MEVFATSFLPGTMYLKKLLQSTNPVIDLGENFIKQTFRNRCYILSSNGPLMLTIPLRKNDSKKVVDLEISYTEDWQTKGLRAIRSSYANSPYYEHYQDEFETLFMDKSPLLYLYNAQLTNWLLAKLDIDTNINTSNEYIHEGLSRDHRLTDFEQSPEIVELKFYKQVFTHKSEFKAGLSGIDLLFNKGPESLPYLK